MIDQYVFGDVSGLNLTWPDVQRRFFAKIGYTGMECNGVNTSDANDVRLVFYFHCLFLLQEREISDKSGTVFFL